MGPVTKRAIPVRQQSTAQRILPPGTFASNGSLPWKVKMVAPVPPLVEKPEAAQSSIEVSANAGDSSVSIKFSSRIGSKVRVGGAKIGTLLFYGKTNFSDGVWCGVSIDEASGKNDGSVNGIRYFTCPPAHGIFVRPTKLEFLQTFDAVQETSVQTLPKNVDEATPCNVPVSLSLKMSGSSINSGKIQKPLNSQKKMGDLKRRFLLNANLNSTTTISSKEACTNSINSLADGMENDPLLSCKISAGKSKLHKLKFQAKRLNIIVEPAMPSISSNNLPSSLNSSIELNLNSTVKMNLNSTIIMPSANSNIAGRVFNLSSEQSRQSSPECTKSVSDSCMNQSPVHEHHEEHHNSVLNYTFDVANSEKPSNTISRKSQEFFMNLSPSNASSPVNLEIKPPICSPCLNTTFELSRQPNLSPNIKPVLYSSGTRPPMECNDKHVILQNVNHDVSSPAKCANETIVIEACSSKDGCLNQTFQVEECSPHSKDIALTMLVESPRISGAHHWMEVMPKGNSETDYKAVSQVTETCEARLPKIEENEQSVNKSEISIGFVNMVNQLNEPALPVVLNSTFMAKKDVCTSGTDSTLQNSRILNSTTCVESKGVFFDSANSIANLSETVDCIAKSEMAPDTKEPTVNDQNISQAHKSFAFLDNVDECEMEYESTAVLPENPVASTPACFSKNGKFFSTLFTPIRKCENWIASSPQLDPALPNVFTRPEVLQVSTNSDQSLGILSASQMEDFTVVDSSYGNIGTDSPVSPSFCNRMFPVGDEHNTKERISSNSHLRSSPGSPKHQNMDKCMKQLDALKGFSALSYKILDEDSFSIDSWKLRKSVFQHVRESAEEKVGPINKVISCRSYTGASPKEIVSPPICDAKNSSKTADNSSHKDGKLKLDDSLLGHSASAAIKLPEDSILDLSACAAVKLPDDSILDLSADDSLLDLNFSSKYDNGLI